MDGRMDGWVVGSWTGGWLDGWMDSWLLGLEITQSPLQGGLRAGE